MGKIISSFLETVFYIIAFTLMLSSRHSEIMGEDLIFGFIIGIFFDVLRKIYEELNKLNNEIKNKI